MCIDLNYKATLSFVLLHTSRSVLLRDFMTVYELVFSLPLQTARYSALIAGIIYGKRRYGKLLSFNPVKQ